MAQQPDHTSLFELNDTYSIKYYEYYRYLSTKLEKTFVEMV